MFDALIIGLHIGSVHLPAKDGQNNANFGAYVASDEGSVGCYRNTIKRTSCYLMAREPLGSVDLHYGVVSGYQKKCTKDLYVIGHEEFVIQQGAAIIKTRGAILEERESCTGHTRGAISPAITFSVKPSANTRVYYVPAIEKKGSHVISFALEF